MARKSIYTKRMSALGDWLRDLREQNGLTTRELAKQIGWSHPTVTKVETGRRRLDVVEYLWLCDHLNADPHDGLEFLLSK